ncbi:hypothetical protein AGMMS49928_06760 [Spirochaetia bacterium]|nr:hypothetical protein AGMMS49928_06760 [Spirochaetia bacterium]
MTIREAAAALGAELVQDHFDDIPLTGAYSSDLLSDVLAHAEGGNVLITVQAHRNTIAVACVKKLPAVIICNNQTIPPDTLEAAGNKGVALLRTNKNQADVSGILYKFFHL